MYYVAVITPPPEEEEVTDSKNSQEDDMYHVSFFKKSKTKGKNCFIVKEGDKDYIGVECIVGKLAPPTLEQRYDELYYHFEDSNKYSVKLE